MIETRPDAEKSIIVFTSDHGEAFGEHGLYFNHGLSTERSQSHVPLIIQSRGLKPGVFSEPVSLLDLSPTLLDLAGLGIPPSFEGKSLLPVIEGDVEVRPVITEWHFELSVAHKGFRLTWDRMHQRVGLYGLDDDPAELRNLIAREPQSVSILDSVARQWIEDHPWDPPDGSESPPPISEETLEQLKRLGYITETQNK